MTPGEKLYDYFFPKKLLTEDNFLVSMEIMKEEIVDSSNPSEFLYKAIFPDLKDAFTKTGNTTRETSTSIGSKGLLWEVERYYGK